MKHEEIPENANGCPLGPGETVAHWVRRGDAFPLDGEVRRGLDERRDLLLECLSGAAFPVQAQDAHCAPALER